MKTYRGLHLTVDEECSDFLEKVDFPQMVDFLSWLILVTASLDLCQSGELPHDGFFPLYHTVVYYTVVYDTHVVVFGTDVVVVSAAVVIVDSGTVNAGMSMFL